MEILKQLLQRNENNINLPLITIDQTEHLINDLKNSNSVGHDDINNKIILKIKKQIAPQNRLLNLHFDFFSLVLL